MADKEHTIKFMPVNIDISDINRFWSNVAFTANPNVCWEWTGMLSKPEPYGRFSLKGKKYSSHRLSYFLSNKEDPKELLVLHKCDNHKCVNPNHLFLGTNADNMVDKIKKGRLKAFPKGQKRKDSEKRPGTLNHMAKLTEINVLDIRDSYSKGEKRRFELAKEYKVSEKLIANIVNRKTWIHI